MSSARVAPWRTYQVNVVLDAPLAFAFRWCTDYTPEDAKFAGEDRTIHLVRKIIERRKHRVVFENVYDQGRGWGWERHTVTLHPPDRWHSEGRGNYHESILDYKLSPLSEDRTRFEMHWRSRPVGLSVGPRPSAKIIERSVENLWRKRARALATEFRRSGAKT